MCYPWMIQHLINSISRCCVNADHLANKILNLITSVIPIAVVKIKFALCNISIQFLISCIAIWIKGMVSTDQDKKDDTKTPHINRLGVRPVPLDFRCAISPSTTNVGHESTALDVCQSKVSYFDTCIISVVR